MTNVIYIYIYIYIYDISNLRVNDLTLILLTWRKWFKGLKVEVICFVLSCFPPSLSPFPRPNTCIGSESRLSLREGSTAQASCYIIHVTVPDAMTSLCYESCEFHWNKRRLRHIHVNTQTIVTLSQGEVYIVTIR